MDPPIESDQYLPKADSVLLWWNEDWPELTHKPEYTNYAPLNSLDPVIVSKIMANESISNGTLGINNNYNAARLAVAYEN